MKVNVYDFDKTIYDGDCSVDFFKFCIKKKWRIVFNIPKFMIYYLCYFVKLKNKVDLKEAYFSFLNKMDNIDLLIQEFWDKNEHKIKKFYMDRKHEKDIIISASPEFLLRPICTKLKVKDLIASKIDKFSGTFIGENCKGSEKVRRLTEKYPNLTIEEVYSDSKTDDPLFKIAKKGYLVKKEKIIEYKL